MTETETLSSELVNCFYTGGAVGLSALPMHGKEIAKFSATSFTLKCLATAFITSAIPDEYTGTKFAVAIADKVGASFLSGNWFDIPSTKIDITSNIINEALYRSFKYVEAHTNKTISVDEQIFVAETYTALFEHPAKYMATDVTMMGTFVNIIKDVVTAMITPHAIYALDCFRSNIESMDIMGMGSNHTEITAEV